MQEHHPASTPPFSTKVLKTCRHRKKMEWPDPELGPNSCGTDGLLFHNFTSLKYQQKFTISQSRLHVDLTSRREMTTTRTRTTSTTTTTTPTAATTTMTTTTTRTMTAWYSMITIHPCLDQYISPGIWINNKKIKITGNTNIANIHLYITIGQVWEDSSTKLPLTVRSHDVWCHLVT